MRFEDGFVPQLNIRLRDAGVDAEIVNAGVSGDTTAGGASRIGWTLAGDIDGLIILLGGNDLLRGIRPAASRENLEAILRASTERNVPVLLIGHEAVDNFGPQYKDAYDAMFAELAAQFDVLLHERVFDAIDISESRAQSRRDYLQADALHPNREGVALIVNSILPKVFRLVDLVHERKEGFSN